MRQNNKRKLIGYNLLSILAKLQKDGVPYKRLVRDYELDISTPHLQKLVNYYHELKNETISADYKKGVSDLIYPYWLILDGGIQIQPRSWKYVGKAPWGKWEQQ